MQHAHLPNYLVGMKMLGLAHTGSIGSIDVEQIRCILPHADLRMHECIAAVENGLGNIEGLGHCSHEFPFLREQFPFGMHQFQKMDQHHELLALVEFLIHFGADLQDLHRVHAGSLPAPITLSSAVVEGGHTGFEQEHMLLHRLGGELPRKEAMHGIMPGGCIVAALGLRDDREELQ